MVGEVDGKGRDWADSSHKQNDDESFYTYNFLRTSPFV